MEEILTKIVNGINGVLWDRMILLFLLLGTGIYYTFKLRFVQVRKFGKGWGLLFKGNRDEGKKGLTSFQALTTAVAAQVGTGNITGAATAIFEGGPGAIFWMWVSAFFGMSTIYSETVMAQKTKKFKEGNYIGGPVYYINYIFGSRIGKFLSGFFAVAIIFALGFMGNMVQANSICDSFTNAFGGEKYIVGIVIALIAALIFVGGIRRIAKVTERVVPVMALLYIVGCLLILFKFSGNFAPAVKSIFVTAFSPKAMAGGLMGISVKKAMRYGVARGLFSNEAGMGSTPHAHATADVKIPSEQGYISMIGVFVDTFVILTLTALVILATGSLNTGLTGSALAQNAFISGFGQFGNKCIAVCMFFFAFTTIISWYYFGEVNVKYLFGDKAVKVYSVLVIICVFLGSVMKVQLVWDMADMFNGFMVIPNTIALLFAGRTVKSIMKKDEKLIK